VPELIENGRVPTPGIGIVAASEAVVRPRRGRPRGTRDCAALIWRAASSAMSLSRINGKPVRRLSDLTDEIEQIGVGKSVRLSVIRGNQTRGVEVDIVDVSRS
jgi:2-alkenal reductase